MHRRTLSHLGVFSTLIALAPSARAWDYEGHRLINQLALAALPPDFPAFVRDPATAERIAWLSSEPDRWRSAVDLPARHNNSPDHFIDLEEPGFAGLPLATVSAFRYEFAVQYARGRAAHPEKWAPIDPEKNSDRTREWCGFLPWTIAEYFGKLQADFARLKVYEEFGQAADAAQTRASSAELMGVMGHFVGDGAQPLHTTIHFNGWAGDNPKGYTVARTFHAWIDGGFLLAAGTKLGDLQPRVKPASAIPLAGAPGGRSPFFGAVMDYLQAQNALVEPLYQLEKEGKLKADGTPHSFDGRGLVEGQLLTAGEMLGRIWVTAWRTAAPDTYLRNVLLKQGLTPVAAPAVVPASSAPAKPVAPGPQP